jgi:hypothetical protein
MVSLGMYDKQMSEINESMMPIAGIYDSLYPRFSSDYYQNKTRLVLSTKPEASWSFQQFPSMGILLSISEKDIN